MQASWDEPMFVYVDRRRKLVIGPIWGDRKHPGNVEYLGEELDSLLPAAPASEIAARAERVKARILDQPIPGSRWATATGCGTRIEGSDAPMAKCGMGHVDAASRRFLWLYTRDRD
jgi:hypothetical protein